MDEPSTHSIVHEVLLLTPFPPQLAAEPLHGMSSQAASPLSIGRSIGKGRRNGANRYEAQKAQDGNDLLHAFHGKILLGVVSGSIAFVEI